MLVVSLAAAKVKNGVSLRDYGIATGEVRNAEVTSFVGEQACFLDVDSS